MSETTTPAADIEVLRHSDKHPAIGGNVTDVSRGWVTWANPANGWVNFRVNWNIITVNSMVVVTASETDGNGVRFIGAAPFTVTSIAPAAGFVVVKINIAWDTPLRIRTDLLVVN